MSDAKFTPGPWRRVNWHVHAGCPVLGRTEGELGCDAVAYVVGGSGEMAREEFQANLSLIAVAPELYAACAAAEKVIVDLLEIAGRRAGFQHNVLPEIRAALAKANGGRS